MENKPPSIFQPIMLTVVAILDLVAAFFMTASNPQLGILSVFLAAEVALIGIAIYCWVIYFRAYVRFEIDHRLGNSDKTS